MESRSEKIARLNDEFRESIGQGGHVYVTPGIQALPPEDRLEVFNLVKTFNDFSEGNDPYGEHDFGAFDFKGDRVFWKIDYYARTLTAGSPNPANERVTHRVLTIMLASEY